MVATGSIRAPSSSSNTTAKDEDKISSGYRLYKDKLNKWEGILDKLISKDTKDRDLPELKKFISGSLDFHPCTHAEMSAILDAGKIGVSVIGSTLYTTTFPCHLCAKDIISSGIHRVVYLEAYPKSKNKELYPNIICIDEDGVSEDKIPFEFYTGVGPKRFYYVYSLDNTSKNGKFKIPMLRFEKPEYYEMKEDDVSKHLKRIIQDKSCKVDDALCELLCHKKKIKP